MKSFLKVPKHCCIKDWLVISNIVSFSHFQLCYVYHTYSGKERQYSGTPQNQPL